MPNTPRPLPSADKSADDIDAVICAASNHERVYPTIAVEIQDMLEIQEFAFDMNVARSSATFDIQAACDMIKSGSIKDHMEDEGVHANNLKRLWLHQANKTMNDYIAKKALGRVPEDGEQPNSLQDYANTSSAGSIIAFPKTDIRNS